MTAKTVERSTIRSGRVRALRAGLVPLLAACLLGCGLSGGTVSEDEPSVAERDGELENDIRESGYRDALEWLRAGDTVLFEGSKEEAALLVQDLLAAGAPKVYMTGIETLEGTQISASMAVEMPADAAARKKVIDRYNEFIVLVEGDPAKEEKQRYLLVWFD